MLNQQEAIEHLKTIRDCIRWGVSRFNEVELFFGHGTDNARDEVTWLVLHALSQPLDLADEFHDCRITPNEREQVVELLTRRIETRQPAAYLTGEAWFCSLPFTVNEHVLVPRSPICELIEKGFSPWVEAEKIKQVLDLCTGSGCIGITCGYAFPQVQVDMTDISSEALAVAGKNIYRHQVSDRVHLIHADVFDGLPEKKYDLIVSNPPYVGAEEMAGLPEEYNREPSLALAAGEDGLDIVRRILKQAADYLSDDGVLVVEVGNSEVALMAAYPFISFTWLEFERGGHGVFLLTAEQLKDTLNKP